MGVPLKIIHFNGIFIRIFRLKPTTFRYPHDYGPPHGTRVRRPGAPLTEPRPAAAARAGTAARPAGTRGTGAHGAGEAVPAADHGARQGGGVKKWVPQGLAG